LVSSQVASGHVATEAAPGAGAVPRASLSGAIVRWGPELSLAALVSAFFGVFGFLTWRQQSNFGTFGFDLGLHDQAIWLAAHGHRMFDTVRGLDYFGENVNLISLAFVPLYWLGAGPHLLDLIHTAALAAGGVPLWLLARDRTGDRWLALAPAVAYFLYPSLSFMAWWEYHPDTLAILPLLFAWWLASRQKWGWFAVCAALALSCKEDVALALVGMSVALIVWRGPAPRLLPAVPRWAGRRWLARIDTQDLVAVGLAVGSMVWFEIATRIIIPANNAGQPPFYESFFWQFGTTPTQVIWNLFRHPGRLVNLSATPTRKTYFVQMFAPVGFLLVLALPAFLIGLPQLLINIMDQSEGLTIDSQYGALVLVGVFIATVEALGYLRRRRPRALRAGATWLLMTSMASAAAWGITPLGVHFHSFWAASDPQAAQLHQALDLVPPTAGVSVSYELTAHASHRVYVFEFPNPWVNVNWLSKAVPERPADVTWLVVDNNHDPDPSLLAKLTAPGGPFKVVYDANGVVAARRVVPAPAAGG
jgi:uncharacterized membrane protein